MSAEVARRKKINPKKRKMNFFLFASKLGMFCALRLFLVCCDGWVGGD